jgi:hypothetical protein
MFGIRWVMLVTAFGVALVKAYIVAKNFMHLDIEKPIVHWILLVALALMVLLYGALAPDVQKGAGQGWKKDAGFHHSFVTSKPHEAGGHEKPESPEHGQALSCTSSTRCRGAGSPTTRCSAWRCSCSRRSCCSPGSSRRS